MQNHLGERGVWVRVGRTGHTPVEGWLLGEIPQGLLVAMSDDLNDVRLISGYSYISYDHDRRLPRVRYDNANELYEELEAINSAISAPMRRAVSRLSFERLHQAGHRSSELRRDIDRARYEIQMADDRLLSRNEVLAFLIAQADQSTTLHREVYDTFEGSGLTDVLDDFGPRLASLPSELTIPAYDLEFQSSEDLASSLEATRDQRWTSTTHRASLEAAEATRTRLIVEAARGRERAGEGRLEQPDGSTVLSRWIGPSLRVLVGTGLATANAAIGVTAGLTATIATIGATAVPTYVGVATSIYTGLAQAADGLEKIGRRK